MDKGRKALVWGEWSGARQDAQKRLGGTGTSRNSQDSLLLKAQERILAKARTGRLSLRPGDRHPPALVSAEPHLFEAAV
jgi:hypothetical protein